MNHLLVSYHTCPLEEPGVGLSGGMNVFLRGLVEGLAAGGIRTDVLTRGKGKGIETTHPFPGVRIFHVPCGWREPPTRETAHDALPRFIAEARDLLASTRTEYDAVSAHYWMSGVAARGILRGTPPRGASRLAMSRVAFMYHTVEARKVAPADAARRKLSVIRKREEERISGECGRVVFLSRHDFARTRRVLPAVTGKSSIAPPGLGDAFLHPPSGAEARRRAGIPAGAFLFLLAARPDPDKNIDAAFEAFRALREEEGGRVRLLVAGQKISQAALPEGVACAGAVPHAEMPSLFAAADAVLHPSTYESFGLVPLEAMAAGTPVIVPLGGYWGKRIRSVGGGVAYPPGAEYGLVDAMRALCRDKALRNRLGEEGKRAAAAFTREKCTASWARLLSRCARPGNPR
ncbi:MAG: glycosyltransferase [Deltaproteobacteria bacterium]|nr:glycosyltransferase [Deltaproteobacteria bacterium]